MTLIRKYEKSTLNWLQIQSVECSQGFRGCWRFSAPWMINCGVFQFPACCAGPIFSTPLVSPKAVHISNLVCCWLGERACWRWYYLRSMLCPFSMTSSQMSFLAAAEPSRIIGMRVVGDSPGSWCIHLPHANLCERAVRFERITPLCVDRELPGCIWDRVTAYRRFQ